MRDIIFRAWRFSDKKIYKVGCIKHYEGVKTGARMTVFDIEGVEISPCYIMQYTGLKDNNGKDIFEGDIVKFGKILGEIKYRPGCFMIEYKHDGEIKYWGMGYNEKLEIIGNRFENTELLNNN